MSREVDLKGMAERALGSFLLAKVKPCRKHTEQFVEGCKKCDREQSLRNTEYWLRRIIIAASKPTQVGLCVYCKVPIALNGIGYWDKIDVSYGDTFETCPLSPDGEHSDLLVIRHAQGAQPK